MTVQVNSAYCPVCQTAGVSPQREQVRGASYNCPRCGSFWLDGVPDFSRSSLRSILMRKNEPHRRALLSHILRRQADQAGVAILDVTDLTEEFLDSGLPGTRQLADNLRLAIADRQESILAWVVFSQEALPALLGLPLGETSSSAVAWLLGQMPGNLFEASHLPGNRIQFRLTGEGWHRHEEILFAAPATRRAFMAMQFGDPQLNTVVEECFKPAARRAGFELRLLTDGQGAGLIDDQMRVALRTSRFVVVDLTHGNRGAYWEAGFAEGLGHPVFYTCREDVWGDVDRRPHFDTRHLATVIWNPESLKLAEKQLTSMIRATLPRDSKLTD